MKFWTIRKHPHDMQAATVSQKHKAVIEERSALFGRLKWRFMCTCGQMSLWVRTEKYAKDLAEVHHDIVLVDDQLREALERMARDVG